MFLNGFPAERFTWAGSGKRNDEGNLLFWCCLRDDFRVFSFGLLVWNYFSATVKWWNWFFSLFLSARRLFGKHFSYLRLAAGFLLNYIVTLSPKSNFILSLKHITVEKCTLIRKSWVSMDLAKVSQQFFWKSNVLSMQELNIYFRVVGDEFESSFKQLDVIVKRSGKLVLIR